MGKEHRGEVWRYGVDTQGPLRETLRRWGFNLRFASDAARSIELLDLSGRTVRSWTAITGIEHSLPITGLAEGAYWVRATEGANRKTRKLLIH